MRISQDKIRLKILVAQVFLCRGSVRDCNRLQATVKRSGRLWLICSLEVGSQGARLMCTHTHNHIYTCIYCIYIMIHILCIYQISI